MVSTPSDTAVRRSIEVDAEPSEAWAVIVDDDERAQWFGGPTELTPTEGSDAVFTQNDGGRRRATIDAAVPDRHLSWTWRDDEGNAAGRVAIELTPAPSGTRIDVTETPPSTHHRSQNSAGGGILGAHGGPGLDLIELEHVLLLRSFSPIRSGSLLPVCVA